eukprot:GEMP01063089.1.p1 GENE.GEMP01063089.1~~GEMP01063089.1.p1  ORF type:complete len:311 (+),score=39.71 GEMP01063089.1:186-1118(+)
MLFVALLLFLHRVEGVSSVSVDVTRKGRPVLQRANTPVDGNAATVEGDVWLGVEDDTSVETAGADGKSDNKAGLKEGTSMVMVPMDSTAMEPGDSLMRTDVGGRPYSSGRFSEDRIVISHNDIIMRATVNLFILVVILYYYNANVYRKKKTIMPGTIPAGALKDNEFPDGICGCCNDCDTCCLTFCCWPCRVADTYITAGIIEKDRGVIAAILFYLFSTLFFCCYFPCKRGELRRRLGGTDEPGNCGCCGCEKATCSDWLIVFFCSHCTIAQEARAVDRAVGMKTTTFCGLKDLNADPLANPIRVSRPSA